MFLKLMMIRFDLLHPQILLFLSYQLYLKLR
jgi:hypothetical protein